MVRVGHPRPWSTVSQLESSAAACLTFARPALEASRRSVRNALERSSFPVSFGVGGTRGHGLSARVTRGRAYPPGTLLTFVCVHFLYTGYKLVCMNACPSQVVLDTNVFVAAGFNPRSHSAQLIKAVRDGRMHMIWDDATRAEIEHIVRQIPHLSWSAIADLFREEDRFRCETHPSEFGYVPDPADRKFAALSHAAQVPLVTSDAGLLNTRASSAVPVLSPSDFVRSCSGVALNHR